MDPNLMAAQIYLHEVKSSMKAKKLRKLATECCQASDAFWSALQDYARTKPQPPAPVVLPDSQPNANQTPLPGNRA